MAIRLGAIASILCAPVLRVDAAGERLETLLLRVGPTTEMARNRSQVWRTALTFEMNQRLGFLLETSSGDRSAEYLKKFKISIADQNDPMTIEEMEARWATGLLQLVLGTLIEDAGNVRISLVVFLGELKGKLTSSQLPLEQTIHARSVRPASEGLILITLYALAENAVMSKKPAHVSCALLSQASAMIGDLRARATNANADAEHAGQIASLLGNPVELRISEQKCAVPTQ
jgi:hypothetical protein